MTLKVSKKPERFKQQLSFGGKACKLSREELQAIGREAIAKLNAGEGKEEVKKWAQSRCVLHKKDMGCGGRPGLEEG